ncbi:MAG: GNAT family N-acetyltransferase [Paenibacillus sp.]|nr:GNAT family N-acetyltransferase [Paenibacillus sp.]
MMFLKHDYLVIRSATAYDAELFCKWWNNGKIMAHAGYPNGLGITKEEILKKLETDNDLNHRLVLEIAAVPVGEMNYRTVENNVAEIGIKICDFSQQEKGYGTTFLMMLINALFNEMGYYKIVLDTNVNNTRAQHVYEKIGFRKMAVHHNSWRNQLGELQSSIDYELTRNQFNNVLISSEENL